MLEALRDVLGFLSDDDYSFTFIEADAPLASREAYFPGSSTARSCPTRGRFSGGLYFFAGVAEGVAAGKRFALIGHHSASKVVNVQRQLVDGLRQARPWWKRVLRAGQRHQRRTRGARIHQRTRSFLFACLALVVARMFDRDDFTFFENGVVSLNIPIAADVLGARATRTTHPKVIRGFEEFFSALLERDIEIRTPFQWLTKTEVVRKIGNSGFADLLATTTAACVRARVERRGRTAARARNASIAASPSWLSGLEDFEPADRYELDLLLDDRSFDDSLRLAVAYVKFFQGFAGTPRDRLISEHPQIAAALSFFDDLGPDEAAVRAHDLYRLHSEDVLEVIKTHIARHAGQLLRREIPSGSLLSMCFNRNVIEPPSLPDYDAQAKSFIDSLAAPVCEFAVDPKAKAIRFRGDFSITGSNFKLVETLLPNHRAGKATAEASVPFMRPHDLADRLRIDDTSLRQQLTRLRSRWPRGLSSMGGSCPARTTPSKTVSARPSAESGAARGRACISAPLWSGCHRPRQPMSQLAVSSPVFWGFSCPPVTRDIGCDI